MSAAESLADSGSEGPWDANRLAHLDYLGAPQREQRERSRQAALIVMSVEGGKGAEALREGLRASLKEAAGLDLPLFVEQLAAFGAPLNGEPGIDGGQSPLMKAAERGAYRAFEALLRLGADASARDVNGRSAMHYAAIGGSPVIVKMAAKAGLSVSARDASGGCPVTLAALSGCGLSAWPQGANGEPKVKRVGAKGWGALNALIELGARVDDPHPQYGQSPLFDLCELDDDGLEAARALLERGADANGTGLDRAPLMGALSSYRPSGKLCELLISYGARVTPEILGRGRKNNAEAFSVCERRLLEQESAKTRRGVKRPGL